MAEILSSRTRLLSLVEILTMYSDEHNILSVEEICEKLSEYGYNVTKRIVTADIKVINSTPIKIIHVNKPQKGYYLVKSFSQSAVNMILEAVYSSPLLSEENCNYIENFLRRNTCLPTLNLICDTTEHIRNCIPHSSFSFNTLHNIRIAIQDKRQIKITVARFVPGDSFSNSEVYESFIINPIKIAVYAEKYSLIFSRIETPDNPEFVSLTRIKSSETLSDASTEFNGNILLAKNTFTKKEIQINCSEAEWILIKFRDEDIDLIKDSFHSSISFRKADEEGYCIAKTLEIIDNSLIGLLFINKDKIEIIKPDSLRDLFNSKIN